MMMKFLLFKILWPFTVSSLYFLTTTVIFCTTHTNIKKHQKKFWWEHAEGVIGPSIYKAQHVGYEIKGAVNQKYKMRKMAPTELLITF